MKFWSGPVPFRLARPIVLPSRLPQKMCVELTATPQGKLAAGDEVHIGAAPVEVGAPDRVGVDVGPEQVGRVHRHPADAVRTGDVLVGAAPVEVGAPDCVVVAPVDVCGVHRHPADARGGEDEVLVDAAAVQVGPAHRGAHVVAPEDVRGVGSHPTWVDGPGDEALIGAGTVQIGAPDRAAAGVGVGPVDERFSTWSACGRQEQKGSEQQQRRHDRDPRPRADRESLRCHKFPPWSLVTGASCPDGR